MVIDSKTTDLNGADNVYSVLVCEAWLPACSKEWVSFSLTLGELVPNTMRSRIISSGS